MAEPLPPPPDDLAAVFGGDAPPEGDMPPLDDEMNNVEADEEALDMAIDEALNSEDPMARREAFKNAVRLCKEY